MKDNDLFEDLTPWDRLMFLQQRVELLEQNLGQIIDAIRIQHLHLEELNKGIGLLQRYVMEMKQ